MKMDGVLVNSPLNGALHILNFSVPGLKSEVLLHALEAEGIVVSTTSACSSKKRTSSKTVEAMFHDSVRSESVIRISTTYSNQLEEAEKVLAAIQKIVANLEKIMRVAK